MTRGMTVITPTGDRPQALALCVKYMERQLLKPDVWLVVNDGTTPLPPLPAFAQVITRDTSQDVKGVHTLPLQLRAALPHLYTDTTVFMEDDDWYAPTYLAYMADALTRYDLIGQGNTIYYGVKDRTYICCYNNAHASLAATGMTLPVYPWLAKAARAGDAHVDLELWQMFKGRSFVDMSYSPRQYIGIKQMPGRQGTTAGWTDKSHNWAKDQDLKYLKAFIGEDTNNYAPYGSGG